MSSNLYWRPASPPKGHSLGDDLKFVLRKSYGEGQFLQVGMDGSSLPYLQGLRDAGLAEAQKLIDAINKHGDIEVWEQY